MIIHIAATTRSPGNEFWFHRTALSAPWQGAQETPAEQVLPAHDPDCFLCAGNVR
ncbi:hypothetical protein ACLK2I_04055 [Escherichia coli]